MPQALIIAVAIDDANAPSSLFIFSHVKLRVTTRRSLHLVVTGDDDDMDDVYERAT
jgi:hypothetical protein